MARDSTGTELNFDNTGPAGPISRENAPQSIDESRPAVPTKDVADWLEKKRERLGEDERRNDAKSRLPKLPTSMHRLCQPKRPSTDVTSRPQI